MLIGLHGKARSGKDTTAQFILEQAEGDSFAARRDAFADRLKISAARALGFQGDESECLMFCNDLKVAGRIELVWDNQVFNDLSENTTWEEWGISGREYLQYYGTEAHRQVFADDFWVDACLPLDLDHSGEILVITDVRFENEAERIHELGGEVWHILRSGDAAFDNHASERPLPVRLIDNTLVNNRDLDHLRDLALSRMERLIYSPTPKIRHTLPCVDVKENLK